MNLSKPFIERPVMTTLLTLALVLVGLMAYRQLPVSDLPSVDYPVINVQASMPGASPQVMAETVATPIERELMTIPGISAVYSSSTPGQTSLVLEFKPDKRMDSAAQDVEAALSRSAHALPSTMRTRPTYSKSNPSQEPILYLALTSPVMTLPDLFHYGNDMVGKRLSMIEGVAHSATYGPERQIEILMDPESMQLKAITVGELRQAVCQLREGLQLQLDDELHLHR